MAVLAADVAGYSRLMAADEESTLAGQLTISFGPSLAVRSVNFDFSQSSKEASNAYRKMAD
jgi:hypothetical protein